MSQLSDSQVMVLAHAAQRDDGVVILPETLRGAAAVRVVKALLDRRLVQEIRAKKDMPAWRRGADYALKITRAGRQAIGFDQGGGDDPDLRQLDADASSTVPKPVRAGSKKAMILALLGRSEGASIEELMEATGWLTHTTRAELTRLRQRGYAVERSLQPGNTTTYRIAGSRQGDAPQPDRTKQLRRRGNVRAA